MSHGPETHIEHAEHAAHAAHDFFDKRVTISIAMIAAVLACVAMAAHRSHTETLRLHTEASLQQTQAANQWARYQAVNIRSQLYQSLLEQGEFAAARPDTEAKRAAAVERWQKQVAKYEQEQLPKIKAAAEEHGEHAKHDLEAAEVAHARADRLDFGELGLQLGVVLCSLAILTKSRSFWGLGILSSAAGAVTALTGWLGLFMDHH